MRTLSFNSEALTDALTIINAGGVIAHATETCYGLACDLRNPDAVAKLFAIKQRPVDQPVSALFASIDDAKKYVMWNAKADELAQKYLPGPLTLILPIHPDPPSIVYPIVQAPHAAPFPQTIGIRISSHPHAQALIEATGFPLSTTSANLHGKPNPYSAADIAKQFENADPQPDLILDSGTLAPTPPSTVIDCTGSTPTTKRSGNVRI